MKCKSCNREINDAVAFCPHCGKPVAGGQTPPPTPPTPPLPTPMPQQPVQQPAPSPASSPSAKNVMIVMAGLVAIALIAGITVMCVNRGGSKADEPIVTQTATPDTVVKHDTVVMKQEVVHEVRNHYATPANPTQVVVTGQNVRLRLAPSLTAATLTYTDGTNVHPRHGQVLTYVGEEGDFYMVNYRGYNVYISKQFSYAR